MKSSSENDKAASKTKRSHHQRHHSSRHRTASSDHNVSSCWRFIIVEILFLYFQIFNQLNSFISLFYCLFLTHFYLNTNKNPKKLSGYFQKCNKILETNRNFLFLFLFFLALKKLSFLFFFIVFISLKSINFIAFTFQQWINNFQTIKY